MDVFLKAPRPDDEVHGPVILVRRRRPDRKVGIPLCDFGTEYGQTQVSAPRGENGTAQQQQDEPVNVAIADAVIDENTVVVRFGDTVFANAAML